MTLHDRPPLTIAVAWNGSHPMAALLARSASCAFVAEVLIAPAHQQAELAAKALASTNPKVRVLPGGDSGIYNAWNKLIDAAATPYLVFHGADDLLLDSTAAAQTLHTAAQQPDGPMLVFTAQVVDRKGQPHSTVHHDETAGRWSLGRGLSPLTPEVVYPVHALRSCKGVDETFRIAGDADLYFRVRPNVQRVDLATTLVEMTDGGASATARHAWTVFCENRRIAKRYQQAVPARVVLAAWAFLGLRHQLYRLGGEAFAARWTDRLRGLVGRQPRYSR